MKNRRLCNDHIFGVLEITMGYTILIHKFIITDDHAESCPFPLLGPALEVVNRTDQLQASRLFSSLILDTY